MAILCEIAVCFVVHLEQTVVLLVQFIGLHVDNINVFLTDKCPFQRVYPVEWLVVENSHSELYHQIATGWIDVAGLQSSVAHVVHTSSRHGQSVHTNIGNGAFDASFFHHIACGDGHAVIMGKHTIEVNTTLQDAVHAEPCRLRLPVAVSLLHYFHAWISLQCFDKSLMAFG